MIPGKTGFAVLLGSLACLAALAGCSKPSLSIASPQAVLPAGENSAKYLDRISSQTRVSQNDAMRGILLLTDGKDECQTFQQRVETLTQRKIVPARWPYQADSPITRGKLAYMLYQACKVSGGVILTLAGPSQRYCLRELQYQGFLSDGAVYGQVTGMEFVAALSRADSFLETGQVPEVLATRQD